MGKNGFRSNGECAAEGKSEKADRVEELLGLLSQLYKTWGGEVLVPSGGPVSSESFGEAFRGLSKAKKKVFIEHLGSQGAYDFLLHMQGYLEKSDVTALVARLSPVDAYRALADISFDIHGKEAIRDNLIRGLSGAEVDDVLAKMSSDSWGENGARDIKNYSQ